MKGGTPTTTDQFSGRVGVFWSLCGCGDKNTIPKVTTKYAGGHYLADYCRLTHDCSDKQHHFFKYSLLILIPDHGYLQSWECGDVVPVSCDSKLLACSALKGKKL